MRNGNNSTGTANEDLGGMPGSGISAVVHPVPNILPGVPPQYIMAMAGAILEFNL